MLCKRCREDQPEGDFKPEDFQRARETLKIPVCIPCLKIHPRTKKEKKAFAREILKRVHCKDKRKVWQYSTLEEKAQLQKDGRTRAEMKLDAALRAAGIEFEFQYHAHSYWLDFAFPAMRLGIEIDGSVHETAEGIKRDKKRTAVLNRQGWYLARFTNQQVFDSIEDVLTRIKFEMMARDPKKVVLSNSVQITYVPPVRFQ